MTLLLLLLGCGPGGVGETRTERCLQVSQRTLNVDLGTWRDAQVMTYSPEGRRLYREGDFDADGHVDDWERWEYDAEGRLSYWEADVKNDGSVDRTSEWRYDADGRLERYSHDSDADEKPDEYILYGYDALGRLDYIEEHPQGGDEIGRVEEMEYSEAGLRTYWGVFEGEDIQQRWYEYNTDSRLSALMEDSDGDLGLEQQRRISYTELGHVAEVEWLTGDEPGVVTSWQRYVYEGALMVESYFELTNGELRGRELRSYDDAGRLLRLEQLSTSGEVSYYEDRAYDAEGRLVRYAEEETRDRGFGYGMRWEYTDEGRVRLSAHDENVDGVYETETTYEYDELRCP
ncbi:MAG: hypothetical protein H6741_05045 [Alphaproteobacteria bacterium]|nr:hypothetical protein [Alphaproteobacteria bacterium]